MSERTEAARRAVRKVIRDARDKNKWRKIVRFRLWMPVALQILLVAALLWYTTSRFPGFVNATNVKQILILALPLIVAAMAQNHALLVGYLDLSVGGMIGLGVVMASFLIGAEASVSEIVIGIGVILLSGVALGLVNAGLIRGLKVPSIIATLATLSILDGISLTMRPTAQGVISPDFVAVLTTSIGPIPVAFIVIVAVAVSPTSGSMRRGRDSSCGRWASTSGRRNAAGSAPTGSGSGPSCYRPCWRRWPRSSSWPDPRSATHRSAPRSR